MEAMLPPSFSTRYGPFALVTGASSGIGAEFARQLAATGLGLILVARRRDRLEALADELRAAHGVEVVVAPGDLGAEDFMEALAPALEGREVGLLVNNAGFGVAGDLLSNDLARELESLYVNCRAPLVLTHSLAGPMVARGRGGVIFLSSVLGHFPLPYMAHYSATKAWDLFLGEGLYEELRGRGVDVLTLCPGGTRTEFGAVAGAGASTGMAVEPVVRGALRGLGRRPTVIAGVLNTLTVWLLDLLPDALRLAIVGRRARNLSRV